MVFMGLYLVQVLANRLDFSFLKVESFLGSIFATKKELFSLMSVSCPKGLKKKKC